ncbi:MAG: HEAT repeat domain-containing protein [Planctomycetota bacterium]|nr:HEAT repeat domain-containing protein [Planctomycetota bacterium]
MTSRKALLAVALAIVWSVPALAAAPTPGPQPTGVLAGIMAKIPSDDAAAAMVVYAELVKLGPQGVKDVAALIVEPGAVDDSKARTVFHGLAMYVTRPGADEERKMFSDTVANLLCQKAPYSVKSFFLTQLRLAGLPDAAPTIGAMLQHDELCDYAAQTLVTIGGRKAAVVLLKELPKAQGKCRLTIIQNLGVVRDAQAGPELLKAAADTDREVRLTALWALANIGDVAATDAILKAVNVESVYERAKGADAALLLAQRLGEAKKAKEAEQIYRTLWKTRTSEKDRHIRCAAVRGLAMLLGAGAMDDLAAAMKDADPQIRAAAAQAALAMPGEEITQKWVQQLAGLPPAARGEVLAMVARRGGPAAEAAVLDATKDKDDGVRLAAINAAAQLSNEKLAPALVAILSSAGRAEQDAAQAALGRMPGEKATAAVAAAISSASPELKSNLLAILTARGARGQIDVILAAASDADAGVRGAALAAIDALGEEKNIPALVGLLAKSSADEKPVVEKALATVCSRAANKDAAADIVIKAMPGADAATRPALIRTLARIGGAKALAAVRASAKAPEAENQDAAIRALAAWPDGAAAPDLLELAKSAAKPAHQVLALRGYVRLANVPAERPVGEKLKMLEQAMAAARRPDDKQMVLGAVGELKSAKALALVVPLMADEGLKEAAAAAAVKIAKSLPGGANAEVKAAMEKVLAASKNDGTRKGAEEILKKAK